MYLGLAGVLLLVSWRKDRGTTRRALSITLATFKKTMPFILLVFVLMGVAQAYVPRSVIAAVLGGHSGPLAVLYGEAVGSVALIQPSAVFPFAGYLLANGASIGALAGFILTAILIGVSTLPIEVSMLGLRFTVARNVLTFVAVFLVALAMGAILS